MFISYLENNYLNSFPSSWNFQALCHIIIFCAFLYTLKLHHHAFQPEHFCCLNLVGEFEVLHLSSSGKVFLYYFSDNFCSFAISGVSFWKLYYLNVKFIGLILNISYRFILTSCCLFLMLSYLKIMLYSGKLNFLLLAPFFK